MINFLSVAYEADENGYRVTKMDVEVSKMIFTNICYSDWKKIILWSQTRFFSSSVQVSRTS